MVLLSSTFHHKQNDWPQQAQARQALLANARMQL